nr:response regulator [Erythrobacter sp. EC-HK427]
MAARGAVPAGRQGKTCLVVDDSRVVRKLAGKIAAELGYIVIEAEDGREALLRCEKAMPDLVVTDWQMPVMSGPEFVRALRALPTTKRPTVVFCTSKGEAKDIHTGIGAGADDYIVKPFTEEALKAKLVKVMAG